MKMYKYVRVTYFGGESQEVDGEAFRTTKKPNDLNRLLEEGWRPVRETVIPYQYRGWFVNWHYPLVLVLLEKEAGLSEETGIQTSANKAPARNPD